MKTTMLVTLGAVGLAAITITTVANAALLSPRAAGNQIIRASGVVSDPNLVAANGYAAPATPVLSPRAAGSQVSITASATIGSSAAQICSKNMAASPKAVQFCSANPAAMPCCK